jgi:tRNA U38,U39,U40 pseudouridine synthase TruA
LTDNHKQKSWTHHERIYVYDVSNFFVFKEDFQGEKVQNGAERNPHFLRRLQQVFGELSAEEFKRRHDQSTSKGTTIETVTFSSHFDGLNFIVCKEAGSSLRSDKPTGQS